MRAHRRHVVAVLFILVVLLAIPAAASNVRIVRLSLVQGDVLINRNTGDGAEAALTNMPIVGGTRIFSDDSDARAEIEFEDGSTLRLAGPGEILFRELSLTGNGSKVTLAEVTYGLVYANITLHGDDDFRLAFNGENISLRKNSRFRVYVDGSKTELAVFKGEIQLQGHPGFVLVKKGETLTLNQDDSGNYELAHNIQRFDDDAWDKARNDYRNYSNASISSYSGLNFGSMYSYGLWDLGYYGAFGYCPGYGYLWQPYGIGAGWDPFTAGAWAYYPGSGWVFVSSTPWGWLPYRYGSWVYVDGFGWGWRPGPYTHWNPVPGYQGHPPRFTPPTPPSSGSGPTTLVGGGRPPRPIPHFPDRGTDPVPPRAGTGTPGHGSTPGAPVGSGSTGWTGSSGRPGVPTTGTPVSGTNATPPRGMNPHPAPIRRGADGVEPAPSRGSNNPNAGRPSGSSGVTPPAGHQPSGAASSNTGGGHAPSAPSGGSHSSGTPSSGGGSYSGGSHSGGGSYSGGGHSGGGSYSGGGSSHSGGGSYSGGSSSSGSSSSSGGSAGGSTPRSK